MAISRNILLSIRNAKQSFFYHGSRYLNTKSKDETVCKKAVNEAEQIVGYPTSFLSLRWLLNDEVANVATHVRKLMGTNHPLLATARDLIVGGRTPTWGLIVLLISKAGGLGKDFSDIDKDITAGILHSQRVLAEVTEMIRTSNILHNSVLNIYTKNLEEYSNLNFGNTLSLLTGDYLLSTSFRELAGLKNQEVNELVSMCLRDLVEAEFIEPRDKQNRPIPAKPLKVLTDVEVPNEFGSAPLKVTEVLGNAKAEWTLRHFLGSASLLAKSCQAALKLANHPEDFQRLGYLFGRNLALAWHAHLDLEIFLDQNKEGSFSLISAPVMFHLQHDPSFYAEILKGSDDLDKCDYIKIKKVVNEGPGLHMTEELKEEFKVKSCEALEGFSDSEAKIALKNIINVL